MKDSCAFEENELLDSIHYGAFNKRSHDGVAQLCCGWSLDYTEASYPRWTSSFWMRKPWHARSIYRLRKNYTTRLCTWLPPGSPRQSNVHRDANVY